jgi:hypothetical protein
MTPINEMSDQEKLTTFLELIEAGVEINTAFVKENEETDVFTHQLVRISCGDYNTLSQPEMLNTALVPASGAQLNQTVN